MGSPPQPEVYQPLDRDATDVVPAEAPGVVANHHEFQTRIPE